MLATFLIGGDISVNTNWTTSGDEYVLVSPISVINGATLTIGNGVTVRPQNAGNTLSIGNFLNSPGRIQANTGSMISADVILRGTSDGTMQGALVTGSLDYHRGSGVNLVNNSLRGPVTIDPQRVPVLAGQTFPIGSTIAIYPNSIVNGDTTWTKFPNVVGYQVLFAASSQVAVTSNATLTIDSGLEVELGQTLAIGQGAALSIGSNVTFAGAAISVAGTINSRPTGTAPNVFGGGIDLLNNAQGTLTNNVINGPFGYNDNTQVILSGPAANAFNTLNGQVTIAPERVGVLAGQVFPTGTTINIYAGSVMNTSATWTKFPNVTGYIVQGSGGTQLAVGNNAVLTIDDDLAITLNEPLVIDPSARLVLGDGITVDGSTITVDGRITSTGNRIDNRLELNDTADGSLQSNLINGPLDFRTGTQVTLITNTLNGQVRTSGRRTEVFAGQTFPAATVIQVFSDSVVNGDTTWTKYPNVVGYQVLAGPTFTVDNGATLTIENDLTITLNTGMFISVGATLQLGTGTGDNNITVNGGGIGVLGTINSKGAVFSSAIGFFGGGFFSAGGTLEDNIFAGSFDYYAGAPVNLINNTINGQITCLPNRVPKFAGQNLPAGAIIRISNNDNVNPMVLTSNVTWPKYPNLAGYRVLVTPGTLFTIGGNATLTLDDGLALQLDEPMFVDVGARFNVGGGTNITGGALTVSGALNSVGGQFNIPVTLSPTSTGKLDEARFGARMTIDGLANMTLIHNDLSAGLTATGANTLAIDARSNYWGVNTSGEIEAKVQHIIDDANLPRVDFGGDFNLAGNPRLPQNWQFDFTNTIGSNVWLDANRNGRRDLNEVGVADAVVTIYAAGADSLAGTSDDVFLGTRITNSVGFWSFRFGSAPTGGLFVQFTLPPDRLFSPKNVADDTVDSDADLVFGRSDVFNLPAGGINFDQDAGVMVPAGAQPPVISNLGGAVSYTENGSAVILTTTAQVADPDNLNFDNGSLTVETTANSDLQDRLAVSNQGNNPGQIGVSGNVVRYGGLQIGVFSGGVGHAPLVFQFNAGATPVAVQALLRRLTFRTLGDTPFTPARTVTFTLTDGSGGTSTPRTKTVNVIAVSDPPVVGFSGTVAYTEDEPPVVLAPGATVTDGDNLDFDTGKLTLSFTAGASVSNRLEIRSQGNAAGQIGVSGNTVTFAGGSIGTFTGGTGTTPLVVTFNANSSLTAVQALLRNLTFRVIGDNPSTVSRTIRLVIDDGDGGISIPRTVTATVAAVNDAPVITGGTLTTYAENATPLKIGGAATVADPDSTDFGGGNLTVTISANAHVNDRLSVLNVGSGAGQIGRSGTKVTYAGAEIGTMSGGSGFTPLVITFNSSATIPATRALIRNITFRTLGDNPSTAARTVRFTVNDGDGGTSNVISSTVHVNATNDKPVISLSGTTKYIENAAPTTLAPWAGVTDVDSPTFSGGKLTVAIAANANVNDRLGIRNDGKGAQQIGASGGKVTYEGTQIGTYSGGSGSTPLVVSLNSNASIVATRALVRAITFRTISENPTTAVRSVTFVLNDGEADSDLVTKKVQVVRVNDAPVLRGFGGSVGYVNNSSSVALATNAVVTDVDSPNFSGGQLTVRFTNGHDASNRLLVSAGFAIDGTRLTRNGVVIGTVSGNGVGLNNLQFKFYTRATPSIVQELVRSIRFRTTGGTSTAQRTLEFSLSDGDGGTSGIVTKTVNVS